jgi:hypothetical protein
MISREHVDDDTGTLTSANTRKRLWARRVVDADETSEDEVSLKEVAVGNDVVDKLGLGDDAAVDLVGEGEDTETLACQSFHVEVDALADL